MQIHTLRCEMLIATSLKETFEVFENPYNLGKITPPWLHLQVVTKDHLEMRKDLQIDYTIRWLGIPMHWRSVIVEYEPPRIFVDQQETGPYVLWRHQHTFESHGRTVRVADRVEYGLPLGILGELAHAVVIKKQLIRIFRYRQEKLARLLGGKMKEKTDPIIT